VGTGWVGCSLLLNIFDQMKNGAGVLNILIKVTGFLKKANFHKQFSTSSTRNVS
jgi:hypothetical protein